jgi:hypothetical protein
MTTPLLCESVRRRHPQEKCASKCIRGTFLSAFISFFVAQKACERDPEASAGTMF